MIGFEYEGTISHGTLRAEDLIPRFLDVLTALDPQSASQVTSSDDPKDAEVIACLTVDGSGVIPTELYDQASELLVWLEDHLAAAAPEGYRFGNTEGDASDYGFWPDYDALDVDQLREVQGWDDGTMLDLAHQFLYDVAHASEAYTEFIRDIARTENEGP